MLHWNIAHTLLTVAYSGLHARSFLVLAWVVGVTEMVPFLSVAVCLRDQRTRSLDALLAFGTKRRNAILFAFDDQWWDSD